MPTDDLLADLFRESRSMLRESAPLSQQSRSSMCEYDGVIHNPERVAKLRIRIEEERHLCSDLERRFTSPYLKKRASDLCSDIDEIVTTFLGSDLNQFRPAFVENNMLNGAESLLKNVSMQRRDLQDVITKFGENAVSSSD